MQTKNFHHDRRCGRSGNESFALDKDCHDLHLKHDQHLCLSGPYPLQHLGHLTNDSIIGLHIQEVEAVLQGRVENEKVGVERI